MREKEKIVEQTSSSNLQGRRVESIVKERNEKGEREKEECKYSK